MFPQIHSFSQKDIIDRKHEFFHKPKRKCFSEETVSLVNWANNLHISSSFWPNSKFKSSTKTNWPYRVLTLFKLFIGQQWLVNDWFHQIPSIVQWKKTAQGLSLPREVTNRHLSDKWLLQNLGYQITVQEKIIHGANCVFRNEINDNVENAMFDNLAVHLRFRVRLCNICFFAYLTKITWSISASVDFLNP